MLIDKFKRPLQDIRISVTDRCNFRCPYCMPAEIFGERYHFLPKEKILSFEITRLTRILVGFGTNKIRITGGEPLLRTDLHKLINQLSQLDPSLDITLTTNGFLLKDNAKLLKNSGLKRITVSLDSLQDDIFRKMNGRNFGINRVLEGIDAATKEKLSPIKINAVVQKGVNDHTMVELARHFKGTGHIVRFIEYMDVGNKNGWELNQVVSAKDIFYLINRELPLEPIEPNYRGEVARRYQYKDGEGEIGIIASVSQPFCGDCSRARLSTDGSLYTCLFASQGFNLRDPLRRGSTDTELKAMIKNIWEGRTDKYSEDRSNSAIKNPSEHKIEMYQIGG